MKKRRKKASFRKLRIIVLVPWDLIPPDNLEGKTKEQIERFKTEYHVISTLRAIGHEVMPIGLFDDLSVIRNAVTEFKPHIAFNLLEEFAGSSVLGNNVAAFLELLQLPYTGCNPRGLTLAQDKALSKKILSYHRILVPHFTVFPLQKKIRRLPKLGLPVIVKSLIEEGSVGIAKCSLIYDLDALSERVQFIHRTVKSDAIVEEFIEGREIYVGVLGHRRLQTLPPWELKITNLAEGEPLIATLKVKWDLNYQKKVGVVTEAAKDLTPEQKLQLERLSKRIYRLLGLSGYARLDYRLRPDGRIYLLEANPNPNISRDEDFALSAESVGIPYEELLQRIISLGLCGRVE